MSYMRCSDLGANEHVEKSITAFLQESNYVDMEHIRLGLMLFILEHDVRCQTLSSAFLSSSKSRIDITKFPTPENMVDVKNRWNITADINSASPFIYGCQPMSLPCIES